MVDNQIVVTKEHCAYCFDVLTAQLSKNKLPPYPETLPKFTVPLFVTWHINGDELRGCIGTFQASPIQTTLQKYALISALQDSRFNPISSNEVKFLNVGVSLLVNFEKGKKYNEWEVGKHGIIIDFEEGGEEFNATFLPEVAGEQNWDIDTTLKHLIRKSGYGQNYKKILDKINLTTYESSKEKIEYQEWFDLRNKK